MLSRQKRHDLKSRLRTIETRHAELDARIDLERRRPNPDAALLQELKRRRLKAKEEAMTLRARLSARLTSEPELAA